jgi:arsenate reductase
MPITLYGIPHCDTVKRARAWLTERGQAVQFHDFKRQGISADEARQWLLALGRDALINRRGTTWRALDAAQQASADTDEGALALMLSQHSVIKRPVVRWPDARLTVGFDAVDWAGRLG